MKFSIGHAAYAVTDMEAALDFYVTRLGLTHAFSLQREGKPWIEYLKVCDGQFLELFYLDKPREAGNAYKHLCLVVDDCEQAVAEIAQKGIKIRTPPKRGAALNIQAWIDDPDGNPIEIMEISPDSPHAKS